MVLVQVGAGDRALRIEPDEEVDGLARIAHRAHHIGVEKDVAPEGGAFERLCPGRRTLDRAEAVCARHQLAGFHRGERAGEVDGGAGAVRHAREEQREEQQGRAGDADADGARRGAAPSSPWEGNRCHG